MSSPQRHRDPRENPYLTSGDGRLRLRALRASVVTICAKQTQFPAGSGGPASRGRGPIRRNVQNKPNLARPQAAGGGNRAEQSQTWEDWGMWAKAVAVWDMARPGSETCKTNPIWPGRTRRGWRKTPYGVTTNGRNCAKRTQFPSGPRRAPERIVQNKPNSGGLAGGWNTHYSTIPSFHHSNPVPIVQNKANRARVVRTSQFAHAHRSHGGTRGKSVCSGGETR